jgi:hypothetical protein
MDSLRGLREAVFDGCGHAPGRMRTCVRPDAAAAASGREAPDPWEDQDWIRD